MSLEERSLKLVVLQHLLCRPRIFRASLATLREEDFFADQPDLSWAYQIAVSYYDTFQHHVTESALLVELAGPEYSETRGKVKEWFALPDDYRWSDAMVQDAIMDFVSGRAMGHLQDALDSGDITDRHSLRDTLQGGLDKVNRDMFGNTPDLNPFSDLEGFLETAVRVPTGVDFIDEILDGGVREGEVLGFVIPTSGGKTTLGLQFMDGCVRRGEHGAVLSSEQRLGGDITVRLCTLAARAHQDDFKHGYKGADPEIKARLDIAGERWQKYFHFFDHTDLNVDTVQAAFAPIYEMIENGMRPRIVVIDWWGRMKDRILTAQPKSLSDSQERKLSRHLLQCVKDEAEKLKITVVVLHQMAGAVAERGHKHKPSSHSAQEDKNFNNMMDFCFTVSKKDKRGNVTMIADKARSTANNEVRLNLDGGHCLFRMINGPDHCLEDLSSTEEEMALGSVPIFDEDKPAAIQSLNPEVAAYDTTDDY